MTNSMQEVISLKKVKAHKTMCLLEVRCFCNVSKNVNLLDLTCNVLELSKINFSWKCPTEILSIPLKKITLPFEKLASDRSQVERLWPGVFLCLSGGETFGLCKKIQRLLTEQGSHNLKSLQPLEIVNHLKTFIN